MCRHDSRALCAVLTRAPYVLGIYYKSSFPGNTPAQSALASLLNDIAHKRHSFTQHAPSSRDHAQNYALLRMGQSVWEEQAVFVAPVAGSDLVN